jgi:molybdopterin-guanine dinucleotide biosynthesis protein A
MIGAVLCGGSSSRMGVDKATLEVGGLAMSRRVADALVAAGCSSVVAIGGDPLQLAAVGVQTIPDKYPGDGPLGGILTALGLGTPCLVVACDLPRLGAEVLSGLVEAIGDHDAAIARSDRVEPLCAAWSTRAASVLQASFDAGERAVHRAIADLDVAWVAVPAEALHNVNTPADLRNL